MLTQLREKVKVRKSLGTIHQWINGRMPLIGIGSVFTAEDALNAVENIGVEFVALGREIYLIMILLLKLKKVEKMKL